MQRIVVVGASLAGLRAIETLRSEGYAGELIAIGEEAELPYDRPPLSKEYLRGEWDRKKIALRRQGVDDLGVTWRLGERAEALDIGRSALVIQGGERMPYDGLLICTGAAARKLPFGQDLPGVHVLRSLSDAESIRIALASDPRVVVVGAGFIGMEVAASCRERGLEVTVVEPLSAPLVRGIGNKLGAHVANRFRDHGVAFRFEVSVEALEGKERVERVRLSDGTKLSADLVIVGIGAQPATDWLEGSGLNIQNGIICNAAGMAEPNIFAAGDVASWAGPAGEAPRRYEHWTHAVQQGVHAAKGLLQGNSLEGLDLVPYVWSDQFDMRIAIAGEAAEDDEMSICHGSLEEGKFLALFGRRGRLAAAVSFGRGRKLNAARRMIARNAPFDEAVAANVEGEPRDQK